MFGYHINQPGMRLQGPGQPRCYEHDGVFSFMYTAKVGQGRQYRCPFYQCEHAGSVIAENVEDQDVELPPNPLGDLKGAELKKAIEMLVFLRFASTCSLSIDDDSPENRDPDYPDIFCTISGQPYFFELGRLVSQKVAKTLGTTDRKQTRAYSFDQAEPLFKMLNEKGAKKYATDGAPVDLVLHFDLRFGGAATAHFLSKKYDDRLASLVREGPYTRVWVFDEVKPEIIYQRSK